MKEALSDFGGDAEPSNRTRLNSRDLQALPVSREVVIKVLDVGEISGIAEWCGLDWKSNFAAMTSAAKNAGFTDTQVAFIGILHDKTRRAVAQIVKSQACNAPARTKAVEMLKHSPNIGGPK